MGCGGKARGEIFAAPEQVVGEGAFRRKDIHLEPNRAEPAAKRSGTAAKVLIYCGNEVACTEAEQVSAYPAI